MHESGEAYFRSEAKEAKPGKEPPVVLQDGEAATPFGKGIIRGSLKDLGRASGICTAFYPIDSLSKDFQKFDWSAEGCFVIDVDDTDSFSKDSSLVEIGVWAVPERNRVSFEFNIPGIPAKLLYKVTRCEPQIWIYAWPL